MGVLSDLEPKKVFHYFEEITKIPHGSGNVGQISDYLAAFARERGLFVIQDDLKNIIIVKDATPGYEEEPALILQGHMDMVAVQKPECHIDMAKEGLKVAVDGDRIYAEGTSLGGDDGIAVAYALAILDSDDLKHPRLEIVITVDEEVGMDGARGIDLSMLKGNRLLNLDSEEEGIFITGCAGGARARCELAYEGTGASGVLCDLTVGGLQGGHSGAEIQKERGNSNCIFGRLLWRLCEELPARLVRVKGGLADNAIPRETKALLLLPDWESQDRFAEIMEEMNVAIGEELAHRDPDFALSWNCTKTSDQVLAFSVADTRKTAALLTAMPNGVQAMSMELPGLVETSLNCGILESSQGKITVTFCLRSSVESAKDALIGKLKAVAEMVGGSCVSSGSYPGWKFRSDSPLRDKMIKVYEKRYGHAPRVEAIHAGLECGILGSKIPNLDCVSIGPDMSDIHTTEETLSISSVQRVWEYLVELLETKD